MSDMTDMALSEIEAGIEAETKAYWMERALRAEGLGERMMTDPPARMSTPLGLLPVNDEGMRKLSDALGKAQRTLTEIATDICQVEHDLEGLKKLL